MADGYQVPWRRWAPEESARAVVLALHGFNDYRNAFTGVGSYLAEHGIVTYAYDQRGFGDTRHRGFWPSTESLVGDARRFGALLRQRYPGIPLVVLGASMGGAVAILASQPPTPFDAVILSAPAVWSRDNMRLAMRTALWLTVHTLPGSTWSGEGLGILASSNLEMLRALGEDPLVIKRSRADTLWGLTNLMDRAQHQTVAPQVPTLVLYGVNDQVIPSRPTCRFIAAAARAPNTEVTFAIYPAGYHMLLRDLDAAVVKRDILAWLDDVTGRLPSGYQYSPSTSEVFRECRERTDAANYATEAIR